MKILHVISGLNQGGAEAMLEKLVSTGRRLDPDIEHSVIVLGSTGVVGHRLAECGVSVDALDLSTSPVSWLVLRRLVRQLRALQSEATIIQTWLWHADLIGGLCARLAGNPRVVWNLRNSMPGEVSLKLTSSATARVCARLSGHVPAAIVCNSEAAMASHTAIGYRSSKCLLIPNGFDLQAFRRSESSRKILRSLWGVADSTLLVGLVARVDPLKDHANFIRAAARIACRYPNTHFALIGDGTTNSDLIAAEINSASLANRFLLIERQTDIPGVMSALDIFCLSSLSEGFPNVLGEAMLCGTPCVSTDCGDARVLVGDNQWLAPIKDPIALANCLDRMLRLSATERCAIATDQRARIIRDFNIDDVWRRYRDLYVRLGGTMRD